MTHSIHTHVVLVIIAGCFCVLTSSGCAARPQISNVKSRPIVIRSESAAAAAAARSMASAGVMTSADYTRVHQLGEIVRKQQRLDDPDVEWVLSLMGKSSSAPAILHVQVMALFLDMREFPPSQRQEIQTAVTPYLSSKDALDRKYAKAVIRRIG